MIDTVDKIPYATYHIDAFRIENAVITRKGKERATDYVEVTWPSWGCKSLHSELLLCYTVPDYSHSIRQWPYGFPCGDYVVHYEDGSNAVLPLRFEYNIRRFDVPSVSRATNDNRYIHTLKAIDGSEVHLFQWEWVNPRPDQRILTVDVRHDNELDVELVVFAISGRAVVEHK